MNTGIQHNMVIVKQHDDGSQEWLCPTCGRRFIMQWPPHYRRTILEAGDENAVHTGGTSGIGAGPVETGEDHFVEPESAEEVFDINSLDDPYLEPFERFLQNIDL